MKRIDYDGLPFTIKFENLMFLHNISLENMVLYTVKLINWQILAYHRYCISVSPYMLAAK